MRDVVDKIAIQRPGEKQVHRQTENRHLAAVAGAGKLVWRTGPKQGDMPLLYLHDFIVD